MAITAQVSLPNGLTARLEQLLGGGGWPVQLTLLNPTSTPVTVLSVVGKTFSAGSPQQQGADAAFGGGGFGSFSNSPPNLGAPLAHGSYGLGPGQPNVVPAAVGNQPGQLVLNSQVVFSGPKGFAIGANKAGSAAFEAALSGAPLGSGTQVETALSYDIGADVYSTDSQTPYVDAGKTTLTVAGLN